MSFFRVWLVLGYQYSISSLSICLTAEIVRISLSQRKRLWSWGGDMAEWWREVERRCRYRQMQLNKIIERSTPICLAVNVQYYTNSMISLEVYFLFCGVFFFVCLLSFLFSLLLCIFNVFLIFYSCCLYNNVSGFVFIWDFHICECKPLCLHVFLVLSLQLLFHCSFIWFYYYFYYLTFRCLFSHERKQERM